MLVIGHRGAPGYRPENTLAAHELAVLLGADRVECDVVPTADGVLVVRHESDLSASTDVASRPDLAHLRRRSGGSTTGGRSGRRSGWHVEDMTLAQVRSVRAVETQPDLRPGSTVYDGRFGVPTLAELLETVAATRARTGRDVSVAVEVKDPSLFARRGLDVAAMLEADLCAASASGVPVVVQSFDPRFLRRTSAWGLPLVQLFRTWSRGATVAGGGDAPGAPGWPLAEVMSSDAGLAEVARYARVLAPRKDLVLPEGPDGSWGEPTDLVARAHDHGLDVHVFSLRNENVHLPARLRVGTHPAAHGRAMEEYAALVAAGVDGVFSDHPDTAVEAVRGAAGRRSLAALSSTCPRRGALVSALP